jgi:hypothetical protein
MVRKGQPLSGYAHRKTICVVNKKVMCVTKKVAVYMPPTVLFEYSSTEAEAAQPPTYCVAQGKKLFGLVVLGYLIPTTHNCFVCSFRLD